MSACETKEAEADVLGHPQELSTTSAFCLLSASYQAPETEPVGTTQFCAKTREGLFEVWRALAMFQNIYSTFEKPQCEHPLSILHLVIESCRQGHAPSSVLIAAWHIQEEAPRSFLSSGLLRGACFQSIS